MKLKIHEKRYPCVYPFDRLGISTEGMFGYCPCSWFGKAEFISFKEHSIKEVWQGEFMRELRRKHLEGKIDTNMVCNHCQDWSVAPWPYEQRGYGDMVAAFVNGEEWKDH